MKQVQLVPLELSDTYALRTLYDYLQEQNPKYDISAFDGSDKNLKRNILVGLHLSDDITPNIDVHIRCMRDMGISPCGKNNLQIDAAILKNCAKPLTLEEKATLREKHRIHPDEPVVVIGFSRGSDEEIALVEELHRVSIVYAVNANMNQFITLNKTIDKKRNSINNERIRIINEYGKLKEIYALADASFNENNLFYNQTNLHNFVEATEGGPFFIVKTAQTKQYGFRELVESDAIRVGDSLEEIISMAKKYLEELDSKKRQMHTDRRAAHIHSTRDKYLPVIASYLNHLLDKRRKALKSDLRVGRGVHMNRRDYKDMQNIIRIIHPDTDWGYDFEEAHNFEIINQGGKPRHLIYEPPEQIKKLYIKSSQYLQNPQPTV